MFTDDEYYRLSEEGANLMKDVLLKAVDVLGFDMVNVNAHNISDYIQTLSDCDAIWEGSNIIEQDERLALLSVVLGEWVLNRPSTKTKQYN